MAESGEAKRKRYGVLPRHVELERRIGWLVRLRWLAVLGLAATPDAVRILAGVRVSRFWVWTVAGGLGLFNLFCSFCRRTRMDRPDPQERIRWATFLAILQSAVDLLALTILLHVSGGVQNPFVTYYVFHVIISAILLNKRHCWAVTAAGAALLVSEVLLHDLGIWPRIVPPGWDRIFGPSWGVAGDLAVTSVVVSTMAVSAALATSIMEQLRRRTEAILELQAHLEERNRSLAEAYEKLQALTRMKDRFLGIATHDIKAPLAAVEGYMRALSDGTVDPCSERGRKWIERSRIRLEAMRRLVTDLLDISKIESGQILTEKTSVDVLGLAREACETFRVQAEAKGLSLVLDAPERLPSVCGSEDRLRQVIENLISNAIKFTDEGSVTVGLSREKTWLVLKVSDTGVGIPEEDLPHVFDDFYRAKSGRKKEGTGLGLAIVHRLVQAHGGTIQVESTLGKGTTFTVRLPIEVHSCGGDLDLVETMGKE